MEEEIDKQLEELLKSIEFPGEEEKKITEYFDSRDFTMLVVEAIHEKNVRMKKILFWVIFIILNILVMSLLGTNHFIIDKFFAFQNTLSVLFFLFLGVSLFGGLIGLIIHIDTSWIHDFYEWINGTIRRNQ
ncbi:MAG: hypothetical protein JXB88_02670 [Spirochaetales bacterium]|nr:hypothetical protein [Spirochaetales bacterium]